MSSEAKVISVIGIVTIIIIGVGAFFMGGASSPDKPQKAADASIVVRPDSHSQKASGAKVTLAEFGDFQCPACGASYPIVTQILQEYKGKVNFAFRQYPLPVHQNAQSAAEASEAAGAQGKFFEMYDALYANQAEWSENKNPIDIYVKYAKNIGLDTNKFKKDVEDKKYEAQIKKDQSDGDSLGVNATPTFFINGIKQTGGLPYNEFKTKIEEALKK